MNKAGAAGGIASEFVAKEDADGYTLPVAGQGQMFINKALGHKMGYDPDTDFKFLGMLGAFPNVLVVNPNAIPANAGGPGVVRRLRGCCNTGPPWAKCWRRASMSPASPSWQHSR